MHAAIPCRATVSPEKVGKTIGFDADEYGDNHPKPPEVAGSITTMPLRVAA